nr:hypothetical protein REQ54_02431 [Rhizobium sp. Q54]
MRFLLTSALMLAAAPALASSITPLAGNGGNGSIVMKTCGDCPPPKTEEEVSGYKVPVLDEGPQRIEIVEIGGEKKLVRTEAWLGGSPVVHISKMQDWMVEGGSILAGTVGDGVDHALVGAVKTDADGDAPADESSSLDLDALHLRLN